MSIFSRDRKRTDNSDENSDQFIKVELHCHSFHSDGVLSPEQIAKNLSDGEVKYASLTDHNTIAGQSQFRRSLTRYGIGYISGIEITTIHKSQIIHILGYGFDLNNRELNDLLSEKSNNNNGEVHHSVMLKVFRTAKDIIELIHKAGGIAILAHPFQTVPDYDRLRILLNDLQKLGLDGVEALYGANSDQTQDQLLEIATSNSFIVSAGTDYHTAEDYPPGINITAIQWKAFRFALLKNSTNIPKKQVSPVSTQANQPKNPWFSFLTNTFLPAFLTLTLFIIAFYAILLPYFENTLLERKRETIKQLTQVAWGVLNEAAEEVESGHLSLENAQTLAKNRIAAMRYGPDNRDYFWIQDLTPRILMHPYRSDLNNQDVTDYTDAQGTRIFVAFADLVREQGEGFISYVWQWMDDYDRLEPKESYIRLFEPWEWLIGTGIYVYDVQSEISNLKSHLVRISLVVLFIVLILLVYLVRQGLVLENSRNEAEKLLLESIERYHALSEAATEGALFVYDNRCRYANTVMYELLGCAQENIELLELTDVFPDIEANKEWLSTFPQTDNPGTTYPINAVLRRCDGTTLSCYLTFKSDYNEPKSGCMILVRRSLDIPDHTGTQIALNRLLHIPNTIASDIADSIKKAGNINEVISLRHKINSIVVSLLENGTSAIAITYMISTITDLTTHKLIELSIEELGPPPVPYTFLALGSHGRQSMTMFSDQDNAIIYQSEKKGVDKKTESYFLKLGSRVCDLLEQAGYKKCPGNKIAGNPQWCQPLHIWKAYFEEWIRNCEPQQVVEFSIFFDYRPVAGDPELVSDLRKYVDLLLKETPFFLTQVAQNALIFKTPLRLFGSIVTSANKEHSGRVDVKSPAIAIISFARLYALQNYVRETNTLDRLDAIKSLGIILDSKHRDLVTAYEKLVNLRLWNQVLAIENNTEPDNWINPNRLGHLEEVILRECFKEIDELHSFIQKDFLS